jgi:hypothetical protein
MDKSAKQGEPRHHWPPKSFPDLATCVVRQSDADDFMECLSAWGARCPDSITDGKLRYCRHETRFEILQRSSQRPPSPRKKA